jgi:hypothetical protein
VAAHRYNSRILDQSGRRGVIERANYLIDRFPVAYEHGGGWTCHCADFLASDACRHTREAAGRYAAQMRIAEHLKLGSNSTLGFHERTAIAVPGLTPAGHRAAA